MKGWHRWKFCLLFVCVVLPSCLTVEQDIVLTLDGSAQVRMSYQLPVIIAMNSQVIGEMRKKIGFVFPLTETEVRNFYRGMTGVQVEMFTSTTEKGVFHAEVMISCTHIENLSHSPLLYTLRDLGGVKVFTISVGNMGLSSPLQTPRTPGKTPASALLENAIAASQRGLMFKLTATFPTRVLSSNGSISGRRVTWVAPLFTGASAGKTFEAKFRATPSLWDKIRGVLGFTQ